GMTTVTGTLSQLNAEFANARVAAAQTLTVQVQDESVKSARPGTASMAVMPGPFAGFAVFTPQNQLISAQNPLHVTASVPVAVMVRPVDSYGNPVNAAPGAYTVDVSDGSAGGAFRTTPSGQDVLQIQFPVGASSEPLYYVNATGSFDLEAAISQLDAGKSAVTMSAFTPYASATSTPGSGTVTVVLKDQNGNAVSGQAANLTAVASSDKVTIGAFTESTSNPGTYTATVKSSANANDVTITVKDGTTTVGQTAAFNA
ncbi:MAG: Ig-like domain-containing protein, partial [Alicyclobacillus sp.]|nr:Ig-like domain-containing protein [Alicyclobacillus sp.]